MQLFTDWPDCSVVRTAFIAPHTHGEKARLIKHQARPFACLGGQCCVLGSVSHLGSKA